jgi:hypothetical protein
VAKQVGYRLELCKEWIDKQSDLPVEQPTQFEFVIQSENPKQIGLTIPPNVLTRAHKGSSETLNVSLSHPSCRIKGLQRVAARQTPVHRAAVCEPPKNRFTTLNRFSLGS